MFDCFCSLPGELTIIIKLQVNKDVKYREAILSISFAELIFSPPPNMT